MFDRKIFFDSVRGSLFSGSMSQSQVDGMNYKLDVWIKKHAKNDLRWCGYALATSYHETGQRMVPVREGFKETDAEARAYVKALGYEYAAVDPVTGEVYYGRGDIQTTWADNYKKVGAMIGIGDELYYDPERMLDIAISADSLYQGMINGIYRSDSKGKQTLARYFDHDTDDPYNAREIVNGDKTKVPNWSKGVSIGNLIKGYHNKFMTALNASYVEVPTPPQPEPQEEVLIALTVPAGVKVTVTVNGEAIPARAAP